MNRLLLSLCLPPLLISVTFCRASGQPDDRQVAAVEKVVIAALDAGQKHDWQRYTELVHPEAIKDFRAILAPALMAAQKENREDQAGLLSFFDGATDLKAVLAWEPKEFFVRFMKKADSQAPLKDKLFSTTTKVLGTILEGSDQAHVVTRVTLKRQKVEIRKVAVVTLKRSGSEWKVMPTEWQELAETIKLSLSGQVVGEVVGKPGAAEHDKQPIYKGKALTDWVKALDQPGKEARVEALKALGEIGPAAAAVPRVSDILKDRKQDQSVRMQAAFALAKIGTPKVVAAPLITALKDEDAYVRQAAATSLGGLRGEAGVVVPALVAALDDEVSPVRLTAAGALGSLGPKAAAAVPGLRRVLKKDRQGEVRVTAATALWQIDKDKGAVTTLFELADDDTLGAAAAASLGGIALEDKALAPRVVPLLVKRYGEKNPDVVRSGLARILKELDSEAAAKAGIK